MAEYDEKDDGSEDKKAREPIIEELRDRFDIALEADNEQRRDAMEDMKFAIVPGWQWEESQKKERGQRPCYEFNKIRVTGKRIINAIRQNRPSGKIRAVEGGDTDVADIHSGLIRNIWSNGAEVATDTACEYQTFAGRGAWRVDIESDPLAFDKDIKVNPIPNPFCLFRDPSATDPLGRDAKWWILTERMSRDQFKEDYPGVELVDFDSHEYDDEDEWESEHEIRVAEYWYCKAEDREIWKVANPAGGFMVVDSTSDEAAGIEPALIVERKTSKVPCWYSCVANGQKVIEGPTKWKGRYSPFVELYGEYYIVDGKLYWNGITRFAKDPQRSYNASRTAITESIMMNPLEFHWATPTQAQGHETKWKEAHSKAIPFRLFNPDTENPGPPAKSGGANIPVALIQEAQMAAEEINMVTGIYQADLGSPNQATSGKQEIARQAAGNIATFNYSANYAAAVEWTWRILLDLVPHVYTTERELRVLGADGREDYVRINQVVTGDEGVPVRINDLSVGKYDVVIDTGPDFHTQRQEAAETYQAMLQGNPDLFPIIGDLVMKSLDYPYSEEIGDRLKAILAPEIRAMVDEGENGEAQMDPEVQAAMAQVDEAAAQIQEQAAAIQEEAQQLNLDKAEVKQLQADLKTAQAEFDAKIAQKKAEITKMQAELVKKAAEDGATALMAEARGEVEGFAGTVAQEMAQAMQIIQQAHAELTAQAMEAIDQIRQEKEKRPRVRRIRMEREGGKPVAVPEWDDDEPGEGGPVGGGPTIQ